MLVSLRNSGAIYITYKKIIDDNLIKDIILNTAVNENTYLFDTFMKGIELDSFIIPENTLPNVLHLTVQDHSWNSNNSKSYEIVLEIGKCHYNLIYKTDIKPDFFKTLFKHFYPQQADKQIEELI